MIDMAVEHFMDPVFERGDSHPLQPYILMVTHPTIFWSIVYHVCQDAGSGVNEVILDVGGFQSCMKKFTPDTDWSFIRDSIGDGNRDRTRKMQDSDESDEYGNESDEYCYDESEE